MTRLRRPQSDWASCCAAAPVPWAGRQSSAFSTQASMLAKQPEEEQKGLASAKSQVMAIAWRAKVLRTVSREESQLQVEAHLSPSLSIMKARYTPTACP